MKWNPCSDRGALYHARQRDWTLSRTDWMLMALMLRWF